MGSKSGRTPVGRTSVGGTSAGGTSLCELVADGRLALPGNSMWLENSGVSVNCGGSPLDNVIVGSKGAMTATRIVPMTDCPTLDKAFEYPESLRTMKEWHLRYA